MSLMFLVLADSSSDALEVAIISLAALLVALAFIGYVVGKVDRKRKNADYVAMKQLVTNYTSVPEDRAWMLADIVKNYGNIEVIREKLYEYTYKLDNQVKEHGGIDIVIERVEESEYLRNLIHIYERHIQLMLSYNKYSYPLLGVETPESIRELWVKLVNLKIQLNQKLEEFDLYRFNVRNLISADNVEDPNTFSNLDINSEIIDAWRNIYYLNQQLTVVKENLGKYKQFIQKLKVHDYTEDNEWQDSLDKDLKDIWEKIRVSEIHLEEEVDVKEY